MFHIFIFTLLFNDLSENNAYSVAAWPSCYEKSYDTRTSIENKLNKTNLKIYFNLNFLHLNL